MLLIITVVVLPGAEHEASVGEMGSGGRHTCLCWERSALCLDCLLSWASRVCRCVERGVGVVGGRADGLVCVALEHRTSAERLRPCEVKNY